mmetsp:Transcript_8592/g.13033  ORF Transcript_8592/g.13033 Transcript_8592/m.13033 type:complete len:232 (-) Transcript_8592:967-1662(-)
MSKHHMVLSNHRISRKLLQPQHDRRERAPFPTPSLHQTCSSLFVFRILKATSGRTFNIHTESGRNKCLGGLRCESSSILFGFHFVTEMNMKRLVNIIKLDSKGFHFVKNGVVQLGDNGALDTSEGNSFLEDGTDRNGEGEGHSATHRGVPIGLLAKINQGGSDLLSPASIIFHVKSVFHTDHVFLSLCILHLLLKQDTHSVQSSRPARSHLLLRVKHSQPLKTMDNIIIHL